MTPQWGFYKKMTQVFSLVFKGPQTSRFAAASLKKGLEISQEMQRRLLHLSGSSTVPHNVQFLIQEESSEHVVKAWRRAQGDKSVSRTSGRKSFAQMCKYTSDTKGLWRWYLGDVGVMPGLNLWWRWLRWGANLFSLKASSI